MTNQEAIETIKANYPPENYSMLREALDIALALLKAQEPVEPKWQKGYARCGKCGYKLHCIIDQNNFCPECGMAVEWNG